MCIERCDLSKTFFVYLVERKSNIVTRTAFSHDFFKDQSKEL